MLSTVEPNSKCLQPQGIVTRAEAVTVLTQLSITGFTVRLGRSASGEETESPRVSKDYWGFCLFLLT